MNNSPAGEETERRPNVLQSVTIKEIAKECNVSDTTVSNILNGKPKASEETRRRVLEVVERKGYKPNYIAQGLRQNKTNTIGVIAEDIAQFTTPSMIESLMAYCEEHGYRTIVQNLRLYGRWLDTWYNNEENYCRVLDGVMQELNSLKVDGIIYLAGHARIVSAFVRRCPIPAVMAYAYTKDADIPAVVIDDEASSYEINSYLISMGHKRIGVVAGRNDNIHTEKRLLGYQRALYDAGLLFNPSLVVYGDWERGSGCAAAKTLVDSGVSAIFCMADRMAGGVYDYLEQQNLRVGTDISVVGFDNQDMAEYFRPGLTTMALPLSEIGKQAAKLLLDRLTDAPAEPSEPSAEPYKEIYIPCRFIERSSVAKIV